MVATRTADPAPGPSGIDMLRAFRTIRGDPLGFLDQCSRRYGSVTAFPIPGRPVLFISDPQLVRHILQVNQRNYSKRTIQYDSLSAVTGEGLLTSDGEAWRAMRRLMQPAFHHSMQQDVVAAVMSVANSLIVQWKSQPPDVPVDLSIDMMTTTLRLVGTTFFGADLTSQASRLVGAVVDALEVVVAKAQTPLDPPAWLPTRSQRALRSALAELDHAVDELISARSAESVGEPENVLDLLLTARRNDIITGTQLRNEIVTLIVAGHETVASSLVWTWLLLNDAPEVRAQLRDEARAVWGDELSRCSSPSGELLAQLPLAKAVVDESLRLFPPAWVISRRAIGDDTLGGVDVAAGATVFCSPYLLHRDSARWPAPTRFVPGRFLDDSQPGRNRDTYLPFGVGPRMCIGREIALLEATILISRLNQHIDVTTTSLSSVELDPGVTLRPTGRVAAFVRGP